MHKYRANILNECTKKKKYLIIRESSIDNLIKREYPIIKPKGGDENEDSGSRLQSIRCQCRQRSQTQPGVVRQRYGTHHGHSGRDLLQERDRRCQVDHQRGKVYRGLLQEDNRWNFFCPINLIKRDDSLFLRITGKKRGPHDRSHKTLLGSSDQS